MMRSAEEDANRKVKILVDKIYRGEADFDESFAAIKELFIKFVGDECVSPVTLNNYGAALSDTGGHYAAITYLQRAVDVAPDFAEAYFNLGVALMNTNRREEGTELIRKSQQFPKNDLAIEAYFDPMAF